MIVEVQGMGFWTRVRLPSSPLQLIISEEKGSDREMRLEPFSYNGRRSLALIQPINRKIQYRSKHAPNQVWYLQICSQRLYLIKLINHNDNKYNQNHQPDKGGQVLTKPEENNAPEEVKEQLDAVGGQGSFLHGTVRGIDDVGGKSHQQI